jgi:hypothetical protein
LKLLRNNTKPLRGLLLTSKKIVMEKITITNADNESVQISINQKDVFLELVNTDDNIRRCEIFSEKTGWFYLQTALEEKEGMSIEEIENKLGLNEVLESYFEENLFPSYNFSK